MDEIKQAILEVANDIWNDEHVTDSAGDAILDILLKLADRVEKLEAKVNG